MSQPSRRCTRAAADIEHSVVVIGEDMRRLSPGELSALRQAAEASVPPAFYWRRKRHLAWPDSQDRAWAQVIAFMANITAKGNDSQKPSPHTQERSFGQT